MSRRIIRAQRETQFFRVDETSPGLNIKPQDLDTWIEDTVRCMQRAGERAEESAKKTSRKKKVQ